MADLNVTRDDDPTIGVPDTMLRDTAPVVDSDHLLPERTHASSPGIAQTDDPDLARMQIEQTRARMSETIDQIEGALLRKKENLQERMDVMAPVRRKARENPWPIIGGVFAAGLVLGLLTGGDDDEDEGPQPAVRRFAADFDRERAHGYHWEERAHTWERRARRLMDLANRQEAELLEMRGDTVPVRRRRGRRLFGRGGPAREMDWASQGYVDTDTDMEMEMEVDVRVQDMGYVQPRRDGYDGMPLHDADSYPPRNENLGGGGYGGYGRDPLPAPI
ncbi:hypothetical protein [Longimicrobium sp.]|uniref:hypothetical protein n=1 Tax=Longimicrobium sp. TaxID=2029185 RepID=UPI002E32C5CB|nr:hypothetical protein [Longimicrobium sp.]HEX6041189.1 hypothetical protein [Longimicrobium sp.]